MTTTSPSTSARDAVHALLNPRSVALVGVSADESKFSGQPLRNLQELGYPGGIFPVNRRGGEIRGVESVTSVEELSEPVDVGFIMVPAADCADAVTELGRKGARAAVVAVSGFAEMGTDEGRALQDQLRAAGEAAGVRILGPNCNGLYNTRGPVPLGYNKTHSQRLREGNVALVSHSGAMLGAFAPVLEGYGQGLSSFISCGNEADLTLVDFLDYLVDDQDTRVITLILDGVEDGPAFRRAAGGARERGKAIVALKLGNSTSGTSAAQAHSSRLAGSRAAYEAVFAADGVVSVPTVETLALAGAILGAGRRPSNRSTVAASTSGAGGVLLADMLSESGLAVPPLAARTVKQMADKAGFAQVLNPFDIGAAGPGAIGEHFVALASDPGAGTMLFFLTPTPTAAWRLALAEGLAQIARDFPTKPIIVVSPAMPEDVEVGILQAAGVPVVTSMSDAITVVKALQVLAPAQATQEDADAELAGHGGVASLSEPESKKILAAAGVPFLEEALAGDADSAAEFAAKVGYPVVLKAAGDAIAHKSENRLVVLNIPDETALRDEYAALESRARAVDPEGYSGILVAAFAASGVDVVLGISRDRDFGPMVVFGAGGVQAELVRDVAVTPAPVDREGALALIGRTKVDTLLRGYRGSTPADVEALADLIVSLSAFAVERADDIEAVDLNPVRVFALGDGVVALDALVVPAQ